MVGRRSRVAVLLLSLPLAGAYEGRFKGSSGRGGLNGSTFLGLEGETLHPRVDFEEFVAHHGRQYRPGSAEHELRASLFRKMAAKVDRHNRRPHRGWTAAVNKLADCTEGELAALRGYRSELQSDSPESLSLFRMAKATIADLPADFSWRPHLRAMRQIRDQGTCGSCWAIGVATVLGAHSELYQRHRQYSPQQLLSCVPNPKKCGGMGGCAGATASLAMDHAHKYGLLEEKELPYSATNGSCPEHVALRMQAAANGSDETLVGAVPGMSGWKRLPTNKLAPLMRALYDQGPVAVSIAAGPRWNYYSSGIMSACKQNAIADHMVTLVGYGLEKSRMYWLLQNSWGQDWGEGGYIRLRRFEPQKESKYCGWDSKPQLGNGCAGGPKKVWVCGSCGILSDAVVPIFGLSKHGWLSMHRDVLPKR